MVDTLKQPGMLDMAEEVDAEGAHAEAAEPKLQIVLWSPEDREESPLSCQSGLTFKMSSIWQSMKSMSLSNWAQTDKSTQPPESLCEICRLADLEKMRHQNTEEQEDFPLGSLFDIRQRAEQCALCWLVVRYLQKTGRTFAPPDTDVKCDLRSTELGLQARNVGESGGRVFNGLLVYFTSGSSTQRTNYASPPGLRICSFPLPKVGDFCSTKITIENHQPFGARILQPHFSVSLLLKWMALCKSCHGDRCENPGWLGQDEYPRNPRFIDVIDMRIVEPSDACKYLALSYVWGADPLGSKLFRVTKSTVHEMCKFGSLKRTRLPRTIKDAIRLTKELGERYLWVDAFCIIQDDETDMAYQTGQMDLIYSRAFLTIVAGTGNSCEAGLPHLYGRSRVVSVDHARFSENLSLSLMYYNEMWDDPIKPCHWRHRGWTYQELLLSRRAVLFFKDQVYWKCECSFWKESVHMEPSGPNELECFETWATTFDEFRPIVGPKFCLDQYEKLMRGYRYERGLTYLEDIGRAFSGIQKRIEFVSGIAFHWGLPRVPFDKALELVSSTSDSYRYICCRSAGADGSFYETPIPTWSWMAWEPCSVHSPSPWHNMDEQLLPTEEFRVIEFYAVSLDGRYAPVSTIKDQETDVLLNWYELINNANKVAPPWMGEGNHVPYVMQTNNFLDSGHIAFWTSCARVRIGPDIEKYLSGPNLEKYQYRMERWSILDNESNCVGFFRVCGSYFYVEDLHEHEFIVISRGPSTDKALGLLDLGEEEANVSSVKYEVHLMEVRWDEREPGVAYRVDGGGYIEESTWMKLDREWKFVVLR